MNDSSDITTFGELQPGDRILGPDGAEVVVKQVYDAHQPDRMYEIELEDGTSIEASGSHLWYIEPENDVLSHTSRLKQARSVLKGHKTWFEEALLVAESDEPFEIGFEDLMNFFDFIPDDGERYFLIKRMIDSIGPIVEEELTYRDYVSGEETEAEIEVAYDARRAFQQMLSLAGKRAYRRRWPVIVGRVVDTDTLFLRYPDANIPTVKP